MKKKVRKVIIRKLEVIKKKKRRNEKKLWCNLFGDNS